MTVGEWSNARAEWQSVKGRLSRRVPHGHSNSRFPFPFAVLHISLSLDSLPRLINCLFLPLAQVPGPLAHLTLTVDQTRMFKRIGGPRSSVLRH